MLLPEVVLADINSAISCHETPKRGMISFRAHFRRYHLDFICRDTGYYVCCKRARLRVKQRIFIQSRCRCPGDTESLSGITSRTTRPICFVTTARTIIADTKNILRRRCSSLHSTHSRVTNFGDMTATWRCDETGYRRHVSQYVNVKKKDSHSLL